MEDKIIALIIKLERRVKHDKETKAIFPKNTFKRINSYTDGKIDATENCIKLLKGLL